MDIERRREKQKVNKENTRQRAGEYIVAYFATHPLSGEHKKRADNFGWLGGIDETMIEIYGIVLA